MLKIGAILLVVVSFVVLLGLIYISLKILRQTQQLQREQNSRKNYQLHPKIKQELEKNK